MTVVSIGERAIGLDQVSAIAPHGFPAGRGQPDFMARPACIGAPLGDVRGNGKGVRLTEHGRGHATFEGDDRDFHGGGIYELVVRSTAFPIRVASTPSASLSCVNVSRPTVDITRRSRRDLEPF